MKNKIIASANLFSARNRESIDGNVICGCYKCLEIFFGSEIKEYSTERDMQDTALCPRCGVDAVLINAKPLMITKDLLIESNKRWFSNNENR